MKCNNKLISFILCVQAWQSVQFMSGKNQTSRKPSEKKKKTRTTSDPPRTRYHLNPYQSIVFIHAFV